MGAPPPFWKLSTPFLGGAIRFAPTRNGQLAAGMWKVWITADEVYAQNRNARGGSKLSVHFHGQIHVKLAQDSVEQRLARLVPIPGGQWLHAIEWRFLLSDDSFRPPAEKKLKKRDKAYVVDVPSGEVLLLDLIVGSSASTDPGDIPAMFGNATPFWQGRLKASHPVMLLARLVRIDDENSRHLLNLRHVMNPHLTFETEPDPPPYVELHDFHWQPSGNYLFVVPMGRECYRVTASP